MPTGSSWVPLHESSTDDQMGVSGYRGLGDQICSQVTRELGATTWNGRLLREHDKGGDLSRPGASVS